MKRKKDFNRIKIHLMFTIIAISLIITGLISTIGFAVFERTLIEEIGHNRSDVLSQIGNQVKRVKNNINTVSYLYYYDQTLNKYLQRMETEDSKILENTVTGYLDGLTTHYQKSFGEDQVPFDVILMTRKGYHYSSFKAPEGYDYMNPEIKIWYRDILDAKGGIVEIESYKDVMRDKGYYGTARCIMGTERQILGYLMVITDESNIYNMYSELLTGGREIYITNEEGTVISSSRRKVNGFDYFNIDNLKEIFGNDVYTITKMHGKDILFTKFFQEDSDLYVMEEIGLKEVLGPILKVRKIIILLVFGCVILACLYAKHFANKMTLPFSQLCDFMMKIGENNMGEECDVQGYTEINILREKLNNMLRHMKQLMENIKQKEKQKRDLELSFLQAQINPHFMYNTLFSVKCMVDMKKNKEASAMLVSFIALLRSTLSNPDEFVTVEKEFSVLEKYGEIQKLRYSDRLEIFCEYDDSVKNKKMPKLLIQPLVENAIFHGIEFKGEGFVIITARQEEENLIITVEDNGVGIDAETLDKINRGEKLSDKNHVGIENVRERIQLNFGGKYGMKIESEQWKGTSIRLYFPAIE